MKTFRLFIILAVAGILVSACAKVVLTERRQARLIPITQINTLSFDQYSTFLKENPPMKSGTAVSQVRRVGNKIKKAVEVYYNATGRGEELQDFQWEFNVIDDPTVNAFCMPGGKVVIFTGILPICKDDDGLAVVMGHEIAHALAHHGNERMSQQVGVQGALTLINAGIAVAQGQPASQQEAEQDARARELLMIAAGMGAQVGYLLPFSRKHESEADQIGLCFMAIAGYDVNQAAPFWGRMAAGGGERPPEFLSTHPSPEKRSAQLQEWAPEARALAQQYKIN